MMPHHIETTFEKELNAIIVYMPELITLSALECWREQLLKLLTKLDQNGKVALLLDTNRHDFESVECLKLLRELLSNEPRVRENISRVAFVQPGHYKEPEIVSPTEAYFSQRKEACEWLKQ